MAAPMPAAETDVGPDLVRRLLADQHPDIADRPLEVLAEGWDNIAYRLGPDLVVRLPRREAAIPLLLAERAWLPVLAPRLPLPTPVPVRLGQPGPGYPWPWTIVTYLPGRTAAVDRPTDLAAAAGTLGRFCAALHQVAPEGAPRNAIRGVPLTQRAELFDEHRGRLGDAFDAAAIERAWAEALHAPSFAGPPVWVHGDLHPANVLVHDGAVSGVIDFGDINAGDPATDMTIAWMLFDAPTRAAFRQAAGVDDATWARGKGWGLAIGVACVANSADNPVIDAIGRRAVTQVLTDATG